MHHPLYPFPQLDQILEKRCVLVTRNMSRSSITLLVIALLNLCQRKCTEIGGSGVRTECMGDAYNTGDGIAREWYEQCCCNMPPPPPPPSPPPPSPSPQSPSPPHPSPSQPPSSPPPPSPSPAPPSPPPPSPPPPPPICPESCCPAEIEVPVPGQEPCRNGLLPRAPMPSLTHAPGSLSFAAT
ncbi:hypothetical protein MKX01_035384 [Papaver californicum]|nr:hypothetical protein MKX01_035384 [Papaver californicum]